LEFLDNVFKIAIARHAGPSVDSKVTVAERAQIALRLVRVKIETEQAVAELVG